MATLKNATLKSRNSFIEECRFFKILKQIRLSNLCGNAPASVDFENRGNQHLLVEVTLKRYPIAFEGNFSTTENDPKTVGVTVLGSLFRPQILKIA
eukprot:SAG11_NODE_63_length_18904_cov_11.842914_13_plen_96_part_00